MNSNKEKRLHRITRHRRVRARIFGTPEIPRLSVFKSNKHIFAQLIDDEKGKTLLSVSDNNKLKIKNPSDAKALAGRQKSKIPKLQIAFDLGKKLAKLASEKNINSVVFDRGGFKYHGRIRAFAQGAREGGLKF